MKQMQQINRNFGFVTVSSRVVALSALCGLSACGGGLGENPTISGRLENWDQGAGHSLQVVTATSPMVMIASAPIDEAGSFSITLPAGGGPKLGPFGRESLCFNIPSCSVQVDVEEVNAVEVAFVIPGVSAVQPQNRSTGTITEIGAYFYVDHDITVTGQRIETNFTFTYNFDLHYKSGWNLRTQSFASKSTTFSTGKPIEEFLWYWGIK